MQARGSLTDTNLRSLLEVAQAERATGTLTLRQNGSRSTTLYFLFGHLFHAVGESGSGDDAVLHALDWSAGEFDFDAKAKLPADETVRSSIPELLERSGGDSAPPSRPDGSSAQGRPAPERQAQQPPPQAPAQNSRPAASETPPAWQPAQESRDSQRPQQAAQPAAQQPNQQVGQPAAQPAANSNQNRTETRPAYRPGENRRGFRQRPNPRHGREAIPVPAGQVMYDSLKTSFVDFPRLITTLEREGHTGYVRLLTDSANGLLYFREGTALECVFDGGENEFERGKAALQRFNDEVTRGQGVLDVVGLSPELVDGLYELTVAEPIYSDLYASWVDMNALLKFLEERRLSGSLMVTATAGTGVIILTEGKLSGAYASQSREVSNDASAVLMLCQDPQAMIEVKAASEVRGQPLDVADVVSRRPAPQPAAPAAQAAPAAPTPVSTPASNYQPPSYQPQQAQQPAASAPSTPMESAAPRPAATALAGVDWDQVVADLQQVTEEQLGNRSRKVKDVLAAADRSQAGIEAAIDQIPSISILFVDASRLEALANDLRARLQTHLR
ncbi:MAG: hypothetical protein DLM67_25495 [Candidatus Nephthysia bennettiae]|uniref:DUF4388 domain-containing protein n=1 Tax=Candidatus Nephthysia bennettiae TaxID=3127016 RepID=UPI000DB2EAE4|nr:MAG: hypothetical protein DLM67_25495 [Candidatus Dormibacteraeota bacterium]